MEFKSICKNNNSKRLTVGKLYTFKVNPNAITQVQLLEDDFGKVNHFRNTYFLSDWGNPGEDVLFNNYFYTKEEMRIHEINKILK